MSKKGEPREPVWTDAEISFLRANYIQMPVADIAARLGRTYSGVRRRAGKLGLQRQDWGRKFAPEEDALLLEKYESSSMSEMALLLGRHPESIRQRARVLGLVNEETAKRAKMAAGMRHDYFSQVDSPMKAYLLGLLATDGCVGSDSPKRTVNWIRYKIAAKDVALAELMRDEISPHARISRYTLKPLPGYTKERKVVALSLSSAQMKADLGRFGIVPRKTFTIQWPKLDPGLEASFILGCFDGDGCLRTGSRPCDWRWDLYSASEGFLNGARQSIREHTGLEAHKMVSKRGLHCLRIYGRSVATMDAWLHADVPGLPRKRLPPGAYEGAVQAESARRAAVGRERTLARYSPERLAQACEMRVQGLFLDEIAAKTGIPRSVIHRWTKRELPISA